MKFSKQEKKELRAIGTQLVILSALGGSADRALAAAEALEAAAQVLRAKVAEDDASDS